MRTTIAALVLTAALVGACSGDDDEDPRPVTTTVERTTTTAASTTTSLTREQEVEATYLRSWDVYARAVRTFDTSELDEVFAKEALALRLDEIEDRKARGLPSRVSVEHDYQISFPEPDIALVIDNYRNHSVLLDPKTNEPVEPDPNEVLHDSYTLELLEGRWKVTFITRSR